MWRKDDRAPEPLAPTLARHAERDEYPGHLRADLTAWAKIHLPPSNRADAPVVDLIQPSDHVADLCATLLYPVTDRPYRELYELACSWTAERRKDLFSYALQNRTRRDELPRHFRSAPYVLDMVMDIGAYRDLHRHRRCQQLRQQYTNTLGYDTPELASQCGVADIFRQALNAIDTAILKLPQPAAQYLLPFATKSRFLFKMDFAELEYISRLRSGVKGHPSYRKIAWEMKQALLRVEPLLGELIEATPPWVEDPLTR